MGVSFTVSGDDAGFTPMFLGATPLVLEEGIHAGWSALSHEVTRGAELMSSLSAEQRTKALEEGVVPGDALYSVGHKGTLPEPSGLRSADMTPQQQRLLRALVEEYVRNADFDVAEQQLAAIDEAGWTTSGWRGAARPTIRKLRSTTAFTASESSSSSRSVRTIFIRSFAIPATTTASTGWARRCPSRTRPETASKPPSAHTKTRTRRVNDSGHRSVNALPPLGGSGRDIFFRTI